MIRKNFDGTQEGQTNRKLLLPTFPCNIWEQEEARTSDFRTNRDSFQKWPLTLERIKNKPESFERDCLIVLEKIVVGVRKLRTKVGHIVIEIWRFAAKVDSWFLLVVDTTCKMRFKMIDDQTGTVWVWVDRKQKLKWLKSEENASASAAAELNVSSLAS